MGDDNQWNAQTPCQPVEIDAGAQPGAPLRTWGTDDDKIEVRFLARRNQAVLEPAMLGARTVMDVARSRLGVDADKVLQDLALDLRFEVVAELMLCAGVDAPAVAGDALPELRND